MKYNRRSFIFMISTLISSILYGKRSQSQPSTPPNIILIMADDAGSEVFGPYGTTFYQTPRLNTLASEGITFNHAYGTPLCTPSRVEIMTGKYNHRNYIRFSALPKGERTFAHELQDAGYTTCVAGKWQLSAGGASVSQNPIEAGFDEFCISPAPIATNGTLTGSGFYWFPAVNINDTWVNTSETDYGPDIYTNFVNDFISRHQSQPFFAYYPMHLPHSPFDATPDSVDPSIRNANDNAIKQSVFRDMIAYLDKLVGQIVDNLESLNLRDNTLIIFTSDNGTEQSIVSPLNGENIQGGKASLTDAGTRLPFIASWKGTSPSGIAANQLIDFSDVYPTFADLAGVDLSALRLDGQSFAHLLRGEAGSNREFAFLYALFKNTRFNGFWARNQRWKLYHDGRLIDVTNDRREQNPILLGNDSPASLAIRDRLEDFIRSLDLQVVYSPNSTALIPFEESFARSSSFDCTSAQNAIADVSDCIPKNIVRVPAPADISGLVNAHVGRLTIPQRRVLVQPISTLSNSTPLMPGTTQLLLRTKLGLSAAPLGSVQFKMRINFIGSNIVTAPDEIILDSSFVKTMKVYESIINVPAGVTDIKDVRFWVRQSEVVRVPRPLYVEFVQALQPILYQQNFDTTSMFSNLSRVASPAGISGNTGSHVGRIQIPQKKGEVVEARQSVDLVLPLGLERILFQAQLGFVNPIQGKVEVKVRLRVDVGNVQQTVSSIPVLFDSSSMSQSFFEFTTEIPISAKSQKITELRLFIRQRNNTNVTQFIFVDNLKFLFFQSA